MTYQKTFSIAKNLFFSFAAVCFLASCQDDEMLAVTEDVETTAASVSESNIESLTITGANTEFVKSVDCNTCSYVVDKNTETIDGQVLGLKPGSVICLKGSLKYGNLNFVNLEGTTENPITIGTCQ
jgi:hypothetical protein